MKLRQLALTGLCLFLYIQTATAQFTLSGEFRPRTQFRNGYRTLKTDEDKPAVFTSQRTRLNFDYTYEDKVTTRFSVQDVRVWGDQDQLADEPNLNVFEAWANVKVFNNLHAKIGRQELIYDDSYLLGGLNWRQTGRSHDAAVFQYNDTTFQAHLGLAFNQDKGNIFNTFYQGDYYKSLHFLWFKKTWKNWDLALIGINRGMQTPDSSQNYTQTFGPTVHFQKKQFSLEGIFYLQTGKNQGNQDVQSFFWSAKAGYQPSERWKFQIGADVLSGTSPTDFATDNTYRTFDILYGLRHGHFGHMDYFYLNFTPALGLVDAMFKTTYSPNDRLTLNMDIHSFSNQATIGYPEALGGEPDKHLGVETDLYFTYKPYDILTVNGGYSHMMAGTTMEIVKGGDADKLTNWAWLSLTFKPVFFQSEKE